MTVRAARHALGRPEPKQYDKRPTRKPERVERAVVLTNLTLGSFDWHSGPRTIERLGGLLTTLSASPSASVDGEVFVGPYRLIRKIATGGMAELFLAKQAGVEGFEKLVAIKRILSHLAYDDEFVQMFRDEAHIVANLSHPNIVQIYDLGKSDDDYYIAMEYIAGRNLSSVAKRVRTAGGHFPPEHLASFLARICDGLHYAHTRCDARGQPLGIIHRDVSPQNIIISFAGNVKLVDFGIAKIQSSSARTRAGVLKGKYAYMSPEQIKGEQIDGRSDLFSIGVVLYEILTGVRPFDKGHSIQTLRAIVQEAHVDCRKLVESVPDEIAEIINKALTKDPNDRYQSAEELQEALESFSRAGTHRSNTGTVSRWMERLFADELSDERGDMVRVGGIGEVVLPDIDKTPFGEPSVVASYSSLEEKDQDIQIEGVAAAFSAWAEEDPTVFNDGPKPAKSPTLAARPPVRAKKGGTPDHATKKLASPQKTEQKSGDLSVRKLINSLIEESTDDFEEFRTEADQDAVLPSLGRPADLLLSSPKKPQESASPRQGTPGRSIVLADETKQEVDLSSFESFQHQNLDAIQEFPNRPNQERLGSRSPGTPGKALLISRVALTVTVFLLAAAAYRVSSSFLVPRLLENRVSNARPGDQAARDQSRVIIKSSPPGARIFVDDIELGITPIVHYLETGSRFDLRLELNGYTSVEKVIKLQSSNKEISLHEALRKRRGRR